MGAPRIPGEDFDLDEPRARRRPSALRHALLRPANAIALLALVLATAGSATAARKATMYTGANVKDRTITSVDIQNGNLPITEFSSTARRELRGYDGTKGPSGPSGDKGATGPQGDTGPKGDPARVATKWAWFDSRYLKNDLANAGAANWYEYNGTAPNGNFDFPNLQWANGIDRSFETVMSLNSPNCNEGDVKGLHCPWGANDGGGVTTSWDSNITAVAEISLMHSQDADIARAQGIPHTRITCFLSANRGTGSSDFDQIGAKAEISGFRQRQVETLTLVGSINRDTEVPTDYMVRVECRDADGTNGISRYYVLGGSMSVVATERG